MATITLKELFSNGVKDIDDEYEYGIRSKSVRKLLSDDYKPSKNLKPVAFYDEDGDLIYDARNKKTQKGSVSFKKKFESELHMIRTLLKEQRQYTDILMKVWNQNTGINDPNGIPYLSKENVELANAIVNSRNQILSMIKEMSSTKKTISELDMKYKKMLYDMQGGLLENTEEGSSMNQWGSNIMQNVFRANSESIDNTSVINRLNIGEVGENGNIFNTSNVRPDIKYEKVNVKIYAVVDQVSGETTLKAYDDDNNVIDDYPIPFYDKLTTNMTEMIAIDSFGKVYPIIIE